MFITFEGIDGSGKSTLIPRVADWLRAQGREVVCTREPGGTAMGTTVRHLLEFNDLCGKARFLLYLADRAEHVERVIAPALAEKKAVLCDRYCESTLAYQPKEFPVANGCAFASGGVMPSLTLLLDVSPQTAAERIYQREENPPTVEELAYLEEVRERYINLAYCHSTRIRILDAEQDADAVFEAAIKEIKGAHRGL